MKLVLLIALFFITGEMRAQVDTSYINFFSGSGITVSGKPDSFLRYDTVKCILVCIDTTNTVYNNQNMFWENGYQVFKVFKVFAGQKQSGDIMWYDKDHNRNEFVMYLTEKKQPINKNTIVWMSK